ncbi:MAG: Holliday junction branch migration protein RuvA [Candidatus Portnoybacteria bacterium CG02_land_8_20_14_3_00_45_8]|uniref:Holliday junction branch migration complex subunit RuvA n=1 Tax=Candidatus Portnoybacteria bacterium CG02_land_8_20_14_3_00_45_8 TaxID=1974807 RepID=A0A2M7D5X2_9BACT|nr:MAG: Holliday junction branch migration protein RuvA [Candidatus Portnoybacteria bacterium CG02_land_8_20_14_3_00_45_8]
MISSLEGKITLKAEKYIILEVNGLGYKVWCAEKTLSKISQKDGAVKLFTYLAVKENSWDLFGFLTFEELELFELLISISGIGPKTAANILSVATTEDLQEAIVLGDETILSRVSGIGKKVAQKIVIELKSKVKKLAKGTGDKFRVADDIEIIDALVAMGYKVYEARDALKQVPEDVKGVENRVRGALKRLGKK